MELDHTMPCKLPKLAEDIIDEDNSQSFSTDTTTTTTTATIANTTVTLPPDWVGIQHESGGIIYLHKPSRVCTWGRPYAVPTSKTIRKHKVPISSIPCMEKWLVQLEDLLPPAGNNDIDEDLARCNFKFHSKFKIESDKVTEYLKRRWPDGISFDEEAMNTTASQSKGKGDGKSRKRKTTEDGVVVPQAISKVITVNIPRKYINPDADGKRNNSVWTVNISQKQPVSLLLEFCQQYLRNEISYVMEETTSSQVPYRCTAVIGGVRYGSGDGPSKKSAKQSAAEATLNLFLPGTFKDNPSASGTISSDELQYLSTLSIDDPQSSKLLNQAGLSLPWQLLRECCQRLKANGGIDEPVFTIEPVKSSGGDDVPNVLSFIYKLSCGPDYEVTGPCNRKKDGQQLAAQNMLKLLHPHLHNWDSIFKLYADVHSKLPKLVTERQCEQLHTERIVENKELLKLLHQEMKKLADNNKQQPLVENLI